MNNQNTDADQKQEPWGHGDHWKAIFLKWDEKHSTGFLSHVYQHMAPHRRLKSAQPMQNYSNLMGLCYKAGDCEVMLIIGLLPEQKLMHMLSAYPAIAGENTWKLKLTQLTHEYGPFEACADFELPWEAPLKCFCPLFVEEKERWEAAAGSIEVNISALAIELKRFDAEPIKVDAGPLLELERKRLRDEGSTAEADALDHLMVSTDGMRTLFCGNTDHASLVGKIVGLKKLEMTGMMLPGYQLEIEALPDYGQGWRNITTLAYLPALGAYSPKLDDLVQGVLWLQARLPQ